MSPRHTRAAAQARMEKHKSRLLEDIRKGRIRTIEQAARRLRITPQWVTVLVRRLREDGHTITAPGSGIKGGEAWRVET